MDHIKPLRLFELSRPDAQARGRQPDEDEQQHLRECEECPRILEVFGRQFVKSQIEPEDAA